MNSFASESTQREVPKQNFGGKLVLVIDDNAAVRDMLSCMLELAGYSASTSAGRESALTWIDSAIQFGLPPELILFDISDPLINVAAQLQLLRVQWESIFCIPPPVIVLTTSKDIHTNLAGVERVIHKPFHVRDLLSEVQQALPLTCNSQTSEPLESYYTDEEGYKAE